MNRSKLASHSLIVLLSVSACGAQAGTSEGGADTAVEQQATPITHARPDDGHSAVVSIVVEVGHGSWFLCAGTLVGPRSVLTAAHCLNDLFEAPLRIGFGANAQQPSATLRVVDRRVHPEYRPEPLADHDLAMLAIEHAVPSTIVPFTSGAPVKQALVSIVGFGATESDETLGHKRIGTARIDEIGSTRFRVASEPSLTCFHDSGSPAFSVQGEAEWLVGVTSSGRSDCAGFSRFMRTDTDWDSFILPNISLSNSLPVPMPEPVGIRPGGGCQMAPAEFKAWLVPSALLSGIALGALRRRRGRWRPQTHKGRLDQ